MKTNEIFDVVMKSSVALLCTTSAACVLKVSNKAVNTMSSVDKVLESVDKICETTDNKVLPSAVNVLDNCSEICGTTNSKVLPSVTNAIDQCSGICNTANQGLLPSIINTVNRFSNGKTTIETTRPPAGSLVPKTISIQFTNPTNTGTQNPVEATDEDISDSSQESVSNPALEFFTNLGEKIKANNEKISAKVKANSKK